MSSPEGGSYPLLFLPLLKERVWGGHALADLGKPVPGGTPIGESWELADLPTSIPDGRSVIANGAWAGRTLREIIGEHRDVIMGAARMSDDGGFPLLIKYLDARENLSVQVHPDAPYVARHPDTHVKCEAWYVIEAEPGAVIYKGIRAGTTREQFLRHVADGTVADDLVAIEVEAGDCHYLPSGTCHALGAGILVAEVQTPSDTTFRVFDWGREGRELHLEQALECIDFDNPAPASDPPSAPLTRDGVTSQLIVRTEHFGLERIDIGPGEDVPVVTNGIPEVWMVLSGAAEIESYGAEVVDVARGGTALMPAGLTGAVARFERSSKVLRVTLPSPLKGMIAQV